MTSESSPPHVATKAKTVAPSAQSLSSSSSMSHPPPPTSVTPSQHHDDTLSKRMSVEKGIVDELLLVCGVIGSTDPDNPNEFIPVTDCLNWLQDLQRALRRDDDVYRPISLLMGKWNVVSHKLLPLLLSSRYDTVMVLTIIKILVILTKPLSDTTKRAGRMVIDTKSKKVPDDVIQEQIKLRDNALQQSELLMEYKRIFCSVKFAEIFGILVSLLAEPLSKTGTTRNDAEHLTIELVLHLFRNLLSAEPILKGTAETSQRSVHLHNELIMLFEKELVLEILFVIAQEMEARENAQYNLLMMELLSHLLRSQDPTAVARSTTTTAKSKQSKSPPPPSRQHPASAAPPTTVATHRHWARSKSASNKPKPGSLAAQLQREKQKLRPSTTLSRHSHFGGTLVVNRSGGKRQYVSAAMFEKGTDDATSSLSAAAPKRKNRKTDPFIGSGRTHACHTRTSFAAAAQDDAAGDLHSKKAQQTLHTFCGRFVKDCYGPLMKSLKNEFRRDSVRLEEGDKVVFFRIIWFFSQWWRVAGRKTQQGASNNAVGQLIFTMDVFMFNLVLNATDTFQERKKYTQLAQSVSLYSEMMQLLQIMYHSKDSTENIMALGLLDRLFYGSDPLDRLPKLLSRWAAGTLTREYACDLVELVHVTLKLLETNSSEVAPHNNQDVKPAAKKQQTDAVTRMKQTAAEFDLTSYIVRKMISNQVVFMYTHVLSHYPINAPHVNHHIVAYFLRLMKLYVVMSDDDGEEDEGREGGAPKNPLAVKPATLEPMLYNIQLFIVLDQVLNDVTICNEKECLTLLAFARSLMNRFAKHTQSNPLAFVECLFRHPVPHRYCELTTNLYVNEELRMIAERELLLEEHRRLSQAEGLAEGEDEGQATLRRHSTRHSGTQPIPTTQLATGDDDDDEEVEWDDSGETNKAKVTTSSKRKMVDSSDEESEDNESVAAKKDKNAAALCVDKEEDSSSDDEENVLEEVEKEGDALYVDQSKNDSSETTKAPGKESSSTKRKLLSDIDENVSEGSPEKKSRIQKHVDLGNDDDDSSDDDEVGFETQPPLGTVPFGGGEASKTTKGRLVIGDDDEDEE